MEKWNNANYTELRYFMIDDLEREYPLIGMQKEEVIEILGKEPDYDHSLCYHIRSVSIDSYQYCLSYEENGTITGTYETCTN